MHGQSVETCWDNRPFLFTLPKGPGKPSRCRRSLKRGEPFRRPCAWQLCLLSRFRSGMCGSSFFQSAIQILRYLKLQACPNHPWPNMTKRILCGFFCSFVACAFMISLKAAKIPKTTGAESRKHRTSAPFFAVIPYSWPRVLSSSDYHTHRRMPIAFCVGEENDSLWFFHQVKPSKEAAAVLWDVTSSGQGLLHSPEFRQAWFFFKSKVVASIIFCRFSMPDDARCKQKRYKIAFLALGTLAGTPNLLWTTKKKLCTWSDPDPDTYLS